MAILPLLNLFPKFIMCFSATASFGASAVLLGAGTICVKKIKAPEQIPLAFIPFIFSVQQFCEGLLWLSLTNPGYPVLQKRATIIFLVFAQIVWPFWVPFSMRLVEPQKLQKQTMTVMLILGTFVSVYLGYCLIHYSIHSQVSDHHIRYELDYPHSQNIYLVILYFIPTIIPPILSGIKRMKYIGVVILLSFLVSRIFFRDYVISVWCFFAAVISILILIIMSGFKAALPEKTG
jgi:hypothetical protein